MNALIIIFALWCAAIVIYNGIVLPSLRYRLRMKLFAERDRLRQAAEDLESPHTEVDDLELLINALLRVLPYIDIWAVTKTSREVKKEGLELDSQARFEVSEIEEVRRVYKSVLNLSMQALLLNSAVLLTTFIPIFLLVSVVGFLGEMLNRLPDVEKDNSPLAPVH